MSLKDVVRITEYSFNYALHTYPKSSPNPNPVSKFLTLVTNLIPNPNSNPNPNHNHNPNPNPNRV